MFSSSLILAVVIGLYILISVFKIVDQYERLVIFRLGKLLHRTGGHGPGLVIVIPFLDKVRRVSIRTVALDVPPQDIITKDNVSLNVNAVVYYRVIDPERAILEVEDYLYASSQLAQTTLRSVCGQSDLDSLLSERETINDKLQTLLDQQTEGWGIKITNVELKNVDLPKEVQRAMGRQAEAERERRAKIIAAEGELQASKTLAEAAAQLATQPNTLQLRYLQTLNEISQENSKILVFPIPMNLLEKIDKLGK
ncbi:MAG TPA: slipin family protein [Bdellovibrionota bacterium]|jgi:regulator of protease activity HflC (stomatin/prohibitin superfamily)|nr:slipin family protein [Bdellovibrionota bacterium]